MSFLYIDDILVYNEHDHVKHLQLVFHKLKDAGQLNPTKCAFDLPKVKLLPYVLSVDGIKTDQDKVYLIAKLKPATTVKDVRWFQCLTHDQLCLIIHLI